MGVPEATKREIVSQLGQAEFALKVALNFTCLKGTPAEESLRGALAQVAAVNFWVREEIGQKSAPLKGYPEQGVQLPLTRQERLGFRWE